MCKLYWRTRVELALAKLQANVPKLMRNLTDQTKPLGKKMIHFLAQELLHADKDSNM